MLLLLVPLLATVSAQNPYGLSQLDQYGRLLNSGNIGGFGWLNDAVNQGTIRGIGDLGVDRRLQGLPPLPLTHDEVVRQLTSTLPPLTTPATARPTTATTPPPVAINNVPEMPPIAEERIHGKFDDDGVFHPDPVEKVQLKRNQIQGTKIRDFSDLEHDVPKSAESDYESDDFYDDPSLRVRRRQVVQRDSKPIIRRPVAPRQPPPVVIRQQRIDQVARRPYTQRQRRIEDADLVDRRQIRIPAPPPPQPPRPQYPAFTYQPRPPAKDREPQLNNLLTEVEEYDDFLEQHRLYRERFPQAPLVPNPYRQLPEGQLPALSRPPTQPQFTPTVQQQQIPQPRVGPPPAYHQQSAPQSAPPYQPQQQSSTFSNPLLNIFNLFRLPQAHALAAPNVAYGNTGPSQSFYAGPALAQGTLVDVQQNPLSLPALGNPFNLPPLVLGKH